MHAEYFLDALTTTVARATAGPYALSAGEYKTFALADVVRSTIELSIPACIKAYKDLLRGSKYDAARIADFEAHHVLIATTYFVRMADSKTALRQIARDTNPLLCERLAIAALVAAYKVRLARRRW